MLILHWSVLMSKFINVFKQYLNMILINLVSEFVSEAKEFTKAYNQNQYRMIEKLRREIRFGFKRT